MGNFLSHLSGRLVIFSIINVIILGICYLLGKEYNYYYILLAAVIGYVLEIKGIITYKGSGEKDIE